MPPTNRRAVRHRVEKRLAAPGIRDLFQLLRQIEIVPADDAVLDEPLAGFRQAGLRRPAAKRRNLEGKSKCCLRWKLLKTGGELKASRSTVLRIFIRGMKPGSFVQLFDTTNG